MDTPVGVLTMGWKVICFSVVRRTKPVSETKLILKRDQLMKYYGPFLPGDLCERTKFPASYKVNVTVGSQSKGSRIEIFMGRNPLSCFCEGKQMLWVYTKKEWITVLICQTFHVNTQKTELLYYHCHTALWITDMSQLCLSVHVVTSPQLNSWAIPSVHGVSICSLKQVWDHSSQIFFPWWAKLSYIVCPFPQAKSTVGDSHHTVAGTCKFLLCKTEQHLEKQKILIVLCPCNKNPQTCLKNKLVH